MLLIQLFLLVLLHLSQFCYGTTTTTTECFLNRLRNRPEEEMRRYINKTIETLNYNYYNNISTPVNETLVRIRNHVVIETDEKQTASIIFLHGIGDSGFGWFETINMTRPPFMRVVCPTANKSALIRTRGKVMTNWFDVKEISVNCTDDIKGIEKSCIYIHSLIDEEIKKGIKPERVIIGGFSQGGAMALYAGLKYPQKLGAIVAVSAWLPNRKTWNKNTVIPNRDIQIFQCHGDRDENVPYELGVESNKVLKELSKNIKFHIYKGVNHYLPKQGIKDITEFLKDRVERI